MHWDAEDLLHGGEDLVDLLWTPVNSVFRNDDGFFDLCHGDGAATSARRTDGKATTQHVHTVPKVQLQQIL